MSLIKKPWEIAPKTYMKVLIYGPPGNGKSTLALSTQNPLHLDFDGGVHRVQPQHRAATVQISSWDDLIAVLKEDLSPFTTLVIDTAGKMLDYMSLYLIRNNPKLGRANGALTQQGYGERKALFVGFLKQVSAMGKHLVFVAHDKEDKDDDKIIIRPEIGGSSGGDLIKELDLVGYVYMTGKKRTISFDPTERYYGKNTCKLPATIDIPDLESSPNNLLQDIFRQFEQSQQQTAAVLPEYNALLDTIHMQLDMVTDAATANDFVGWVGRLTHIWDSKVQAQVRFKEKVVSLDLAFDKATKQYVAKPKVEEPAEEPKAA